MHNSAIKSLGLNACYIRTPIIDGNGIIDTFKALKLDGANVTVPHKESAYKLCDKLSEIATNIGAVNTLVKKEDKIVGFNTDAPGFYRSIESFDNIKTALILGAGGTAKAISYILNLHEIKTTILNRSKERLDIFSKNGFETFCWEDFEKKEYDIIINTTTAGLKDEIFPLDEYLLCELMDSARYAFDVIYGKTTPFLKLANIKKLLFKDGSDMLLHQASIAFNLFYDKRFELDEIENFMIKVMNLS